VCPHCRGEKHYATKKVGRYRCANPKCRKDYTVMTGTVMKRSHAPLTHWAYAFTVAADAQKGFSAHQLIRQLGCQYHTARAHHHRGGEAMARGGLQRLLGVSVKIVKLDELYFGNIEPKKPRVRTTSGRPFPKSGRPGPSHKRAIVALVERGGEVRTSHIAVR